MKLFRYLGRVMLIGVIAGLAACGGGGGGSDTTNNNPNNSTNSGTTPGANDAFANPARFVPAGQALLTIAASNCLRDPNNSTVQPTPVESASLTISANGDMAFSGAVGGGPVTELIKVALATSVGRTIRLGGAPQASAFARLANAASNVSITQSSEGYVIFAELGRTEYECNFQGADLLTPNFVISSPHIADTVLRSAGATVTLPVGATRTGQIVSWDSGDPNNYEVTPTFARFASLDLQSAEIKAGNSAAPDTHIPIALPLILNLAGVDIESRYEEELAVSGDKFVSYINDNIRFSFRRVAATGKLEFQYQGM